MRERDENEKHRPSFERRVNENIFILFMLEYPIKFSFFKSSGALEPKLLWIKR